MSAARRIKTLALMMLVLQGCQTAQLQHSAGTAGRPTNELAWIVTPLGTKVLEIDGEAVPGNYKPLPGDDIQNWIAVLPGKHTLRVFYEGLYEASASSSTIEIESFAGRTNYVYARAQGGVRYYGMLLDRPADEALIAHVNSRIPAQLPCTTLPCGD